MKRPAIALMLAAGALGACLSGCAVGPNFHQPAPPKVASYRPDGDAPRDAAAPRLDATASIAFDWWRLFHSPALDALVARAIANKPALLLADEPTGALDPTTATDIFALIREVCREEQCALLLVTHDLDLAGQLPRQVDCRSLVTHLSPKEVRS